jgi:hypothetical protein
MQTLTGYKPSELKDCVTAIHELQLNRKCSSMMAIRDKYKQHRVSMSLCKPHMVYLSDRLHNFSVLTVQ